jgi:hypothetical protein
MALHLLYCSFWLFIPEISTSHLRVYDMYKTKSYLLILYMAELGDICIRRLYMLFQWASTIKIQLSVLVWYNADLIIISLKINLFLPWYSWKIAELALNNNHLLYYTWDKLCQVLVKDSVTISQLNSWKNYSHYHTSV